MFVVISNKLEITIKMMVTKILMIIIIVRVIVINNILFTRYRTNNVGMQYGTCKYNLRKLKC